MQSRVPSIQARGEGTPVVTVATYTPQLGQITLVDLDRQIDRQIDRQRGGNPGSNSCYIHTTVRKDNIGGPRYIDRYRQIDTQIDTQIQKARSCSIVQNLDRDLCISLQKCPCPDRQIDILLLDSYQSTEIFLLVIMDYVLVYMKALRTSLNLNLLYNNIFLL